MSARDAPRNQLDAQYQKLFNANDPKTGGTHYLQSKILRAYEALAKDGGNKMSSSG